MKVINSNTEIKIYELKFCHECRHNMIYTRYPKKPHKNKTSIRCSNCGHIQPVYGVK